MRHGTMLKLASLAGSAALAFSVLGQPAAEKPAGTPAAGKPDATAPAGKPGAADGASKKEEGGVLDLTVKSIDGKDVDLRGYKGRVVLIVNVASQCGYTGQYAGLERLFGEKREKGLVVLGFPANDFGNQEPGSDADIKAFCTGKFNVTFPMFAKVGAKGPGQHPLFRRLAQDPKGGEPKWNFTKYLLDRDGNLVASYASGVTPADPAFVAKIDELLAKPASAGSPAATPGGPGPAATPPK